MGDEIKINNPERVLSAIMRQAKLLGYYAEFLEVEKKELVAYEQKISQADQILTQRKRENAAAMEQTKKYEDSPAKQEALKDLQVKQQVCEKQEKELQKSKEGLANIRSDYAVFTKNGSEISTNSRILSAKLERLLGKIIDSR